MHIYEGLSGKLITTVLKPGRRSKSVDVFAILKRIVLLLRKHWKNTRIILRGDAHFCSQPFMDWADTQHKVNFITGLTANPRLLKMADHKLQTAIRSFEQGQKPVKLYHSFPYQASYWENPQKVVAKIEVTEKGTNTRFIVTDLIQYRAKGLYELGYCKRGKMELYIKDHKTYLKSDRSSCNRFEANQFRLFLHSAAYVLIHTLQQQALKATRFATATFKTIQLKVLKAATYIKELKSKIKISLPR